MNTHKILKNITLILSCVMIIGVLSSCSASGDNPGYEYAPNMYHSVPYEGLSQIKDKKSGEWVSSIDDKQGEYYNSNPYNEYEMTLKNAVPNTVKRRKYNLLPYNVHKDSVNWANENVKNPLLKYESEMSQFEKEGEGLYMRMCSHCHGKTGQGDGPVTKKFAGVPKYNIAPYKNYKEGRIFHAISKGKGRMRSHASQISIEDRWKIVLYVQKLQQQ